MAKNTSTIAPPSTELPPEQNPSNPDNQINLQSQWGRQMETFMEKLGQTIAHSVNQKVSVVEQPPAQDRENWTTKEEAEKYESWLDQDFVEFNPKTGQAIDRKIRYKLMHVSPEFQTVNQEEYKAKFFIQKFIYKKNEQGVWTNEIQTSFLIYAKEFLKTHTLLGGDPNDVQ